MNDLRKSLTACGIHLTETACVLPHIQVLWCRQAPGVSVRKLRDHSEAPGDASRVLRKTRIQRAHAPKVQCITVSSNESSHTCNGTTQQLGRFVHSKHHGADGVAYTRSRSTPARGPVRKIITSSSYGIRNADAGRSACKLLIGLSVCGGLRNQVEPDVCRTRTGT